MSNPGIVAPPAPPSAAVRDRGVWAAGTTYVKSDIVTYSGARWITAQSHTASSAFDATKFISISGSINPLFSTYNVTPGNMKYSRAALAAAQANTRDFRVATYGDSIVAGLTVTNPTANTYIAKACSILAAKRGLTARRGPIFPYDMSGTQDAQWTSLTGWSPYAGTETTSITQAGGGTGVASFTPTDEAGTAIQTDSFIVYALKGQGNFQWAIDGGGFTTQTVAAGSGFAAYTVSAGARGFHTLNIKPGVAAPYIACVEAVDSLNHGIRYISSGNTGQLCQSNTSSIFWGTMNAFGPDLFLPEWWVNDYGQQSGTNTPAALQTHATTIAQSGQTYFTKKCDVLWVVPGWLQTIYAVPASSFLAALDAAADAAGTGVLHFEATQVDWATASAAPMLYYGTGSPDAVHLGNIGHYAFGGAIAALLGAL